MLFISFFKQKTAYEMRISDWSSDVCSSDLIVVTEMSHSFDQPSRPGTDDPQIEGHDVIGDEFIVGDEGGAAQPDRPSRRRLRNALLLLGPLVLLLGGLASSLHGGRYETTDNAYLQSAPISVSPNIPRRVIAVRSEEHTSELQSLMRISYAVFCL